MAELPFWRTKTLQQMSQEEWESLCDGCGRCCLNKLEDEDTGELYYTCAACRLLDTDTGHCRDYEHRCEEVPDCIVLTPESAGQLPWLPTSCAYRRLARGQDLPDWHPLITGDPMTVRRAGISVAGRVVNEESIAEDELQDYIIRWIKI